MNTYAKIVASVVTASVLFLTGCEADKEPSQQRLVLKAGKQVLDANVGWVAVPNSEPQVVVNKDKNLSYAAIGANQVIPVSMHGWLAMPANLFAKMSDIKVETKEAPAVERWVLKPVGKRVPKDKEGWVAVPFTQPEVESRSAKRGLEMASLSAGNIVPKEMNGWVAVDADTLAKLVAPYLEQKGPGAELPKERKQQ